MESFEVESSIILEPNHRGRIELRARKDKHRGTLPCAVAVIRRSAVAGHVPRKVSAVCALLLRQNHLRVVLFNTRVQSCHKKIWLRGCAQCVCLHVGGMY